MTGGLGKERKTMALFKKKLILHTYDKENEKPLIKASICNGEQVAGFKNLHTGEFREVMLIRGFEDLETFCLQKDDPMILNCAVLFGLIDFYGKLLYMAGEHEQGNQVGDCHKSVEGIGDVPKQS